MTAPHDTHDSDVVVNGSCDMGTQMLSSCSPSYSANVSDDPHALDRTIDDYAFTLPLAQPICLNDISIAPYALNEELILPTSSSCCAPNKLEPDCTVLETSGPTTLQLFLKEHGYNFIDDKNVYRIKH